MEGEARKDTQPEGVHVVVQGTVLVCTQTPTGSWVCCAKDGFASCARGFSLDTATANWERSQAFVE
jgi:hypothetical protein